MLYRKISKETEQHFASGSDKTLVLDGVGPNPDGTS